MKKFSELIKTLSPEEYNELVLNTAKENLSYYEETLKALQETAPELHFQFLNDLIERNQNQKLQRAANPTEPEEELNLNLASIFARKVYSVMKGESQLSKQLAPTFEKIIGSFRESITERSALSIFQRDAKKILALMEQILENNKNEEKFNKAFPFLRIFKSNDKLTPKNISSFLEREEATEKNISKQGNKLFKPEQILKDFNNLTVIYNIGIEKSSKVEKRVSLRALPSPNQRVPENQLNDYSDLGYLYGYLKVHAFLSALYYSGANKIGCTFEDMTPRSLSKLSTIDRERIGNFWNFYALYQKELVKAVQNFSPSNNHNLKIQINANETNKEIYLQQLLVPVLTALRQEKNKSYFDFSTTTDHYSDGKEKPLSNSNDQPTIEDQSGVIALFKNVFKNLELDYLEEVVEMMKLKPLVERWKNTKIDNDSTEIISKLAFHWLDSSSNYSSDNGIAIEGALHDLLLQNVVELEQAQNYLDLIGFILQTHPTFVKFRKENSN